MRPIVVAAVAVLILASPTASHGDDSWRPFADRNDSRRPATGAPRTDDRPPLAPMEGLNRWLRVDQDTRPPPSLPGAVPPASEISRNELPPLDARGSTVQSGELAPAMAPDGSGLPFELWQGLDIARVETLMTELDIPPRSPALGAMWRRLLTADVSAPAGGTNGRFEALRLEALYRSGLIGETADVLAPQGDDAILALMRARLDVTRGRTTEACAAQRTLASRKGDLPPPLRIENLLIGGFCAISSGNAAAAGLAADLAREEGAPASFTLSLLDAAALGLPPDATPPRRLSALDDRLLRALRVERSERLLDRAEPALLTSLAEDTATRPAVRVAAAEAAARMTAIGGGRLAEAYRQAPADQGAASESLRRATLFRAAEQERTPQRKARAIRAFLDDARQARLYVPAGDAMRQAVENEVSDDVAGRLLFGQHPAGEGLDASEQFTECVGLGQIVVAARS